MSSSTTTSTPGDTGGGLGNYGHLVASPAQLTDFVKEAGDALVIIDVRNPDASVEPQDVASLAQVGLPGSASASSSSDATFRPKAIHLPWDRSTKSMPLPQQQPQLQELPKDTPIITHCGGGGRAQAAKEFLEAHGFTRVVNGGGPREKECWNTFGDL